MIDPLTITLISGLVQGGVAAYRNVKASKGLAALEKQRLPSYMDAAAPIQENKQMYSQMARTGMGPASLNLARNQFAAGQNALAAAPAGGQLRTQIGRLASANAGGFANQLAAQNEAIRRQGMAGVAQANLGLSGLQQRDVGVALQRRMDAERAYGQAIQDSRREMLGAAAGIATGMIGQQRYDKQMDYYNKQLEMYNKYYNGNKGTGVNPNFGQTPSTFPGVVQPPGTFPIPKTSVLNGPVPNAPVLNGPIPNPASVVQPPGTFPVPSFNPVSPTGTFPPVGFNPINSPGTFPVPSFNPVSPTDTFPVPRYNRENPFGGISTPGYTEGNSGTPGFIMGGPGSFRTPYFIMGGPGSFRTPSSILSGSYYNPYGASLYSPEFIESKG